MYKVLYNKALWICMIVAMFSCGEDFVTKEFKNGVVDENFFQNAAHAEQALTAVYDIISSKGMYREAINGLGDCPSDDINELTGDNGDYGTFFRAASDFRWFPSNPFSSARWYDGYKGIFRANILLEKLPDIDMDDGLRNQFAAEAKFLRALYYYNLVVAFGDVPFVTTALTREEYTELARTDKAVIYAQMEKDLQEAAGVLPETPQNLGRATRGAANGLLSRIYLYQQKWSEAATSAEAVINSGTYQLVGAEDYTKMFNGQMENSIESIIEFQAVGNAPGAWGNSTENFYSFMWSPVIGWANWFSPSVESYTQYAEHPEDIRRKAFILVEGADPPDMIDVDGDGVQEPFPSGNMNTTYFNGGNVRKYLPEGKNMANANNHDVNFPIVRYAEVLLNHAEAETELGNVDEALVSLNMVRTRALVPATEERDQAALRELVRQERRKELLFEGHRYYDLARWGLQQEKLAPLGFVAGRHEYWPVPTAELDLMPNLTQYPPQ